MTRAEHDQQAGRLGGIGRHERGVHGVHRNERDVTGAEVPSFLSDPLFDDAAAEQDDLLLVRVTVEVVALPGLDLHVEDAQPRPLRHVGRAHDPTEVAPVEFLPLDVIDADEAHDAALLSSTLSHHQNVIALNAWVCAVSARSVGSRSMLDAP